MEEKTIEQKVAHAILQEGFEVRVGPKTYPVHPISYGTLIRISSLISTLPAVDGEENIFSGALRAGTHARTVAEIVALCILNRKETESRYKRTLFGKKLIEPGVSELTEEILYHCTLAEVGEILRTIFSRMELADFFGVMVSLSGVNLLRETATTASGHPSEE